MARADRARNRSARAGGLEGRVAGARRRTAGRPAHGGALDERFHATLVSAAGNAEIARVHQDVTDRIRIVRRLDFTRADRIEATYAEHAKVLRAVLQRKLDAAQMVLKSHIEQPDSKRS
ncbi:MAG: FCD domain-containing protein [Rubrivivax sp.]